MPTYSIYLTPADKVKTLNAGTTSSPIGGTLDLSVFPNLTEFTFLDLTNVTFKTGTASRLLLTNGAGAGINLITGSTGSSTIPVPIDGIGAITKRGSGLLILTGANSFTGNLTIALGTLQIGAASFLGNGTHTGAIALDGVLNYGSSANQTFSGNITGSGNLIISGTGTLALLGANTYSGTTTINSGTLQVGNGGTAGTLGLAAVSNGATLVFNRSGNLTAANAISGAGVITQRGTGTLTLTDTSAFSGPIQIFFGKIIIAGAGLLNSGTYSNVITISTILEYSGTGTQTLSGVISGTGALVKSGTGSLTLSGANTYSGGTSVSAGILQAVSATAFGTGVITLQGGSFGSSSTAAAALSLANNIAVAPGTTTTLAHDNTTSLTLAGLITGSGSLLQNLGGTAARILILTGDNSGFSGTFTQNNSAPNRLAFNSLDSGSAAADWVFSRSIAGAVGINAAGATSLKFGSLAGSGQMRSNTNGTVTIEVGGNHNSTTFSGVISQGNTAAILALTKVGSGALTLTGANTYLGATSILAGSIVTPVTVSTVTATATFTNTTLAVSFSAAPTAGQTFKFFPGATTQTYTSVTLTNSGGRTASYNSATSTLTIA